MSFGHGAGNIAVANEAVKQRAATRLSLLLEEWFLDTTAGLPYLQRIVEKPTDLPFVESIVKQKLLGTEGMSSIETFDMVYDSSTRKLSIAASVLTVYDIDPLLIEVAL
jgi:hypothetical protein